MRCSDIVGTYEVRETRRQRTRKKRPKGSVFLPVCFRGVVFAQYIHPKRER